MKLYKIGVIGGGAIAQACHIPGYLKSGKCELTAIADPCEKSLQQVQQAGFIFKKKYADYRKMLAENKFDAVSICTPNKFHKDAAIAAIRNGADVLLEKPIATSVEDGEAIVAEAKKYKARVMVAFSHRFNEHYDVVRKELQKGSIGNLYMARIRFAHSGPFPGWAKTDWFYSPNVAGGGALLDMGIHAFDLIQWFMGHITALMAKTATLRKKIDVDDNAVIICEFGNKALGYIEVGWTSPAGFVGVELMGDNGCIFIDYLADKTTMIRGVTTPSGKTKKKTTVLYEKSKEPLWARQMKYFISMIGKKQPFAVGLEEGLLSLKAACASYKSSRTGKRITIR